VLKFQIDRFVSMQEKREEMSAEKWNMKKEGTEKSQ